MSSVIRVNISFIYYFQRAPTIVPRACVLKSNLDISRTNTPHPGMEACICKGYIFSLPPHSSDYYLGNSGAYRRSFSHIVKASAVAMVYSTQNATAEDNQRRISVPAMVLRALAFGVASLCIYSVAHFRQSSGCLLRSVEGLGLPSSVSIPQSLPGRKFR